MIFKMEPELERGFEIYSKMILYGKDAEAERFLARNPSVKGLVTKLRNEETEKDFLDRAVKKSGLEIGLIEDVGIPKNCAIILVKEFYEFDSVLKVLIDGYRQLTDAGLSSIASTGALVYSGLFLNGLTNVESIISNYFVLCSAYDSGTLVTNDLEMVEAILLGKFWRYVDKKDREEFVLGIKAVEQSGE